MREEGYLLSELFTQTRKACFLRSALKFARLKARVEVCHNCGTSFIHIFKAPGNQHVCNVNSTHLYWNYMLDGSDGR